MKCLEYLHKINNLVLSVKRDDYLNLMKNIFSVSHGRQGIHSSVITAERGEIVLSQVGRLSWLDSVIGSIWYWDVVTFLFSKDTR